MPLIHGSIVSSEIPVGFEVDRYSNSSWPTRSIISPTSTNQPISQSVSQSVSQFNDFPPKILPCTPFIEQPDFISSEDHRSLQERSEHSGSTGRVVGNRDPCNFPANGLVIVFKLCRRCFKDTEVNIDYENSVRARRRVTTHAAAYSLMYITKPQ